MSLGDRNGDCWHWKDYTQGAYTMLNTLEDGSAVCDFCKKILDKKEQAVITGEVNDYCKRHGKE